MRFAKKKYSFHGLPDQYMAPNSENFFHITAQSHVTSNVAGDAKCNKNIIKKYWNLSCFDFFPAYAVQMPVYWCVRAYVCVTLHVCLLLCLNSIRLAKSIHWIITTLKEEVIHIFCLSIAQCTLSVQNVRALLFICMVAMSRPTLKLPEMAKPNRSPTDWNFRSY